MTKVALLVAQDVQDEEFLHPYEEMKKHGVELDVILAPKKKYPNPTGKGGTPITYDKTAQEVVASGKLLYDAIIIPGGWAPEVMRLDAEIMTIVRYNIDKGSIIAAICHGTQVLLSAKTIPRGTWLTGYVGTKHDIQNAGYLYPDKDLVQDKNIITCSHYKHNQIFTDAIIKELNSSSRWLTEYGHNLL